VNDRVNISPAPDIPGLIFRPFRDESDYANIVALHQACAEADQVDAVSSLEGIPTVDTIARSMGLLQNFNPKTDMIFAEIDGQVVGHRWIHWTIEQDGTWLYTHRGLVIPAWRSRGIGGALMRWAEKRIQDISAGHPTEGRGMVGASASSTEKAAESALLDAGYIPLWRLVDMRFDNTTELPSPEIPDGFEIRSATPDQYRAAWQAHKEAWSDAWGATQPTEAEYQYFLSRIAAPELLQVAWNEGRIVGVALCEISRKGAEIMEPSVHPDYRRHGLGRALLLTALHLLKARGIDNIRLFTDAKPGSGSKAMYESVGFKATKEHIQYRKPLG
jgi:mycothiol synthase